LTYKFFSKPLCAQFFLIVNSFYLLKILKVKITVTDNISKILQ